MTESLPKRIDIWTVAGIAAIVFLLSTFSHEAIGHGGACIELGERPVALSAYYFECDTHLAVHWKYRVVAAAGSTVNLILMIVSGLWLSADLAKPERPHGGWTVFLWLMFALNGFTWAGYFLFSGIAGIGDWGVGHESVLTDAPNALLDRAIMAAAGGVLYFLIGRGAGQFLGRIVGGANPKDGRNIAWTAYVTGGLIGLPIGLMNPIGIFVTLASAVASTWGGASGFMWTGRFIGKDQPGVTFALPRNWLWIAAGVGVTAAYALILGPTITLS